MNVNFITMLELKISSDMKLLKFFKMSKTCIIYKIFTVYRCNNTKTLTAQISIYLALMFFSDFTLRPYILFRLEITGSVLFQRKLHHK